jgi:hypothetical protein
VIVTVLRIGLLAALTALVGCAALQGSTSRQWIRPGGTPEALQRDRAICLSTTRTGGTPGFRVQTQPQGTMFNLCMEGKGWKQIEQPAP